MISQLKGPEHDLIALETLLRREGAKDITVLRNEQVTRTSMETALHALGLRSKPGDWIVLYYSGHGTEAEAAVKGTKDGDYDQFIPLGAFDPDGQDTESFIVDKDFYTWLSRYVPSTVQVLMIADTCHSGTMNRSVAEDSFAFTPRMAFRATRGGFTLPDRPAPRFPALARAGGGVSGTIGDQPREIDRPDLPNLVFIGAAQDYQLALEAPMPVSGAPSRGIMTYAFEKGLTEPGPDGKSLAADKNRDGKVTVQEIGVHIDAQVRALSANRQQPNLSYAPSKAEVQLFQTLAPPKPPEKQSLPGVLALGAAAGQLVEGPDYPWRKSTGREDADFFWDTSSGAVMRRSGDLVAQYVETLPMLRGVVEKWNAVEALRPMLDESKARMEIGPQRTGARYAPGAKVNIRLRYTGAAPGEPMYAVIFNLASDGTVQMLYPSSVADGEGRLGDDGILPEVATLAVAPYGADHVVALVLPKPAAQLRELLGTLEGKRNALQLVKPIGDLLKGGGGLSIAELYTGQ